MGTIKDSKAPRVEEVPRCRGAEESSMKHSFHRGFNSCGGCEEGLSSREMGQEAQLGVIPNQSRGRGRDRERDGMLVTGSVEERRGESERQIVSQRWVRDGGL